MLKLVIFKHKKGKQIVVLLVNTVLGLNEVSV